MKRESLVCLFILVLGMLALAEEVEACSCLPEPYPPCKAYAETPLIFSGTAIDVFPREFVPGDYQERKATIRVEAFHKGTGTKVIDVFTDGRCGIYFEVDKKYLVYGSNTSGRVETGMCSRTQPLEESKEDLNYFSQVPFLESGGIIYGSVEKFALNYGSGGESDMTTPVANVSVRIIGPKTVTLRTDRNGKFKVTGFPPGQYFIELKGSKLRISAHTKTQPIDVFELKDRGCAEAKFYADFEGSISGRVVDSSRKGVAGLDVQLVNADYNFTGPNDTGPMLEWTRSKEDGSYVFDGIPPGRYRLGIGIAGAFDVFGQNGRIFYPITKNPNDAK